LNTRIVTDSTCDLPDDLARKFGIEIVPNYINVGNSSLLDGLEISHESFYREIIHNHYFPKTSSPGNGLFESAYQKLISEGATDIISIHIHTGLSNLANAARIAARMVQGACITVLEVGQVAMGLGFIVQAAAEAALNGESVDEIIESIKRRDLRTTTLAALDTLEYLKASGRAPALVVGFANLLDIKPVIRLQQGILKVAARVRTSTRCIDWLAKQIQGIGPLENLAVLHTYALDRAEKLRDRLYSLLPNLEDIQISEATPALGVHVGPRAVGLVYVKNQ
jgi:DegV family protein with EDD domain